MPMEKIYKLAFCRLGPSNKRIRLVEEAKQTSNYFKVIAQSSQQLLFSGFVRYTLATPSMWNPEEFAQVSKFTLLDRTRTRSARPEKKIIFIASMYIVGTRALHVRTDRLGSAAVCTDSAIGDFAWLGEFCFCCLSPRPVFGRIWHSLVFEKGHLLCLFEALVCSSKQCFLLQKFYIKKSKLFFYTVFES